MAKYRKILVAYDGSASAKNALSVAAFMAREDKSWIKVLAVVPTYEGDLNFSGVSNIKETIEGPGQKLLAEARFIADREDVHILTNLEQGEPYEQIIHVAEDENCDLIVMGRRGQHKFERELMGSVTARVIGYTNKTVLVVPEHTTLSWNSVLLATDGSPYSEEAVSLAFNIVKERSAQLSVVYVVNSNEEFLALAPKMLDEMTEKAQSIVGEVKLRAGELDIKAKTFVREGEPHQEITKVAKAERATVIVMGSHGRKGLNRLLMGSVTERTIGYADCPIMIAH